MSIWVVPSAAITASTPDDMGPFFDPGERQGVPPSAVLQGAARRARFLIRTLINLDDDAGASSPEYLLRLGDDRLVLGHRLSEWCGHGPILEEDIALANIALDLIGEATLLLQARRRGRGEGRNEDALAYFREAVDYRNVLLVELPKGDFAFTIVRQFFFSVFSLLQMEALGRASTPSSPVSRRRP